MDLLLKFQEFIHAHQLLNPQERCLLAVSGGVDSMVLADLFRQNGWAFGLAHCNFQLRGPASDGDETFVRSWAARWEVPVFVRWFDTKKQAAEMGVSVQMAARSLRYAWFEEIRSTEAFDKVATGHHLNDSVETSLLHLIRGTGLTGLTGIPVKNNRIIRPLLFATRDEIIAYAQAQHLEWREDSSNAETDYTRNAIRHLVLPPLLEINPDFLKNAATSMQHLRAADTNLQFLLRNFLGHPDSAGVYHLQKDHLQQLPALTDGLFDLLQAFGFSAEQVRQLVACWEQTGTEWESNTGYRLVMDRNEILLTNQQPAESPIPIHTDDLMLRLPDGSSLFLTEVPPEAELSPDWTSVLLNPEQLQFPLHLRHWKPGDTFQPYGMAGKHQKLQDFFTNQKLSRLEKEQVWILENGDQEIIWVAGLRLDERFKTEKKPAKLLKLTWVKPK